MNPTYEWARRWQSLIVEHMRENVAAHELLKSGKTPAAKKHVKRMMQIERELKQPATRRGG